MGKCGLGGAAGAPGLNGRICGAHTLRNNFPNLLLS
jgi:hypothetical protein